MILQDSSIYFSRLNSYVIQNALNEELKLPYLLKLVSRPRLDDQFSGNLGTFINK